MKLFEHQIKGIKFLKKNPRAILADEMGLGKTYQAIYSVENKIGSKLIVCPASIKINWEREIKKVYPDANIVIITGKKKMKIPIGKNWIIINYDIMGAHKDELKEMINNREIVDVILDEAHYIKGRSIRAKATLEVLENADKVYCLTGTPLMNRPIELWNLLIAIKHPMTQVKGARASFSKTYCDGHLKVIPLRRGIIRFWDESGATNLGMLRANLKGFMIRRKKVEVLNLPKKIIGIIQVDLNMEQRRIYENAWESYLDFVTNNPPEETTIENIIASKHLVEIQKLKQICSLAKVIRIVADIKNAIDQGQKIIVFTQYKKTLEQIVKLSQKIKIETGGTNSFGTPLKKKIKVVQVSGDMKQDQRQKSVDSFQTDPMTKVFVGNIKASGIGITLTEASMVIFADMAWTPQDHTQAEDRAHRIGQTGTVNVYYYVCQDTIETDIIELLARKKKMVDEVVDGTKDRVSTGSIMGDFIKRMGERNK